MEQISFANISMYKDDRTANTNLICARQRAENLFVLGSKKILELCVGPSLCRLENEYKKFGMTCYGNDIDSRWKDYYPGGKWIIGDALNINNINEFDTLVFAPPLSKGCSGRREDSLSLEYVNPSYYAFLERYKNFKGIKVLVLPGRTLSLRHDREMLYKLLATIESKYDIVELKNHCTKYVDIYIK